MAWKLIAVAVALLLVLQAGLTFSSWKRPSLGVVSGGPSGRPGLHACPGTPNCVCSQEERAEFSTSPLHFKGDSQQALARLKEICREKLGYRLIQEEGRYLRFECVSPIARYVDDLEFLLEPDQSVIEFRSASRVGKSDFGVNRERVEQIRKLFEEGDH